jgi:hypothetical protein
VKERVIGNARDLDLQRTRTTPELLEGAVARRDLPSELKRVVAAADRLGPPSTV